MNLPPSAIDNDLNAMRRQSKRDAHKVWRLDPVPDDVRRMWEQVNNPPPGTGGFMPTKEMADQFTKYADQLTNTPTAPNTTSGSISANEYPYNLQGDQTAVRQLAAQAQSGNSGALEKLRSLGLDSNGNLVAAPAPSSPAAPQQPAPPTSSPSGGSSKPYANPQSQIQQQRLELNRQQFEFQKQRYNDQQAAAASRMQAQQRGGRAALPPSQGAGGFDSRFNNNPMERMGNMFDGVKTPAKPQAGAGGSKGGRGGGGGGGGSRGKSPEDKARDKAREARQTQLENQKMNRRDENKWAKNQGYGSMDEYNRAQKRNEFFNRGKDNKGGGNSKSNKNSPGGDPSYGPGTGGDKDTTGDDAAAKAMYDHLDALNPEEKKKEPKDKTAKKKPSDPNDPMGIGERSSGVTYVKKYFGPAIGVRTIAVA